MMLFERKPAGRLFFYAVTAAAMAFPAFAAAVTDATEAVETAAPEKKESPWMLVPLVSSNPKLGTSLGAMAGYLHHFDKVSPVSMFGIAGTYSSTSSAVLGAFARTFFDEGRQRLNVFAVTGKVNNDYDNFNNSGYPVQSQGDMYGIFARYLYRVETCWFVGLQGAATNYNITGDDAMSQTILNNAGITGFDSNGLGLVVNYDSRDNVNTPTKGIYGMGNNVAFRKALGGSDNFDVYALTVKQYLPHSDNVFAWKLNNQWTVDAPASAYASVSLRGYTRGQYIAPDMSSFEIEERIGMAERWGFTAFTGIACLYGDGMSCGDSSNLYPNVGGGLYYILKPKEKIAMTLEYADGESDNQGLYLQMGWNF